MVFFSWNDSSCHSRIIDLLRLNKVLLGDSDTVLGLLCQVNEHNVRLLDEIKGRSNKPYIILIESIDSTCMFVDKHIVTTWQPLLATFWPGPLTVIFKASQNVPQGIKAQDGTVALRSPKHLGLQAILPHFKGLFSTSANLTGHPLPNSIAEVDATILKNCTAIVQNEGHTPGLPSTIIDCTGEKAVLIREGALSKKELEAVLGYKI